jgi:hypothetical protein
MGFVWSLDGEHEHGRESEGHVFTATGIPGGRQDETNGDSTSSESPAAVVTYSTRDTSDQQRTGQTSARELVIISVSFGNNTVDSLPPPTPTESSEGFNVDVLQDFIEFLSSCVKPISKVSFLADAKFVGDAVRIGFSLHLLQGNKLEMLIDLNLYRKKQWQVDAFSLGAFTGNPAAVVCNQFEDDYMQNIGTENNLAETSFIQRRNTGGNDYNLRWYSS